ncbi:MAG: Maf family protein [Planctomycetota bacterium]|nr:septum formation protein Maf [Planctomycetaceae bacterium]MDQ3331052.1 Maf family protein [Planctomycetota bacterium]
MASELILASTSPYRRALLERLGVTFRSEAPGVDEDAVKHAESDPVRLAERLASAKAEAIAERFPNAIVIASDQLATIDGEVLGKPGTARKAVEQLERLAGRTHELVTAVCVLRLSDGVRHLHTDRTRLTMRSLSRDALERYVALDTPLDCAGAYKIESAGIAMFDRIETQDFTAITGLPLIAVVRMLGEFGVRVP